MAGDESRTSDVANTDGKSSSSSSSTTYWQNLEEHPMMWWLGLDMWKNPANVLLISSVPFCVGAYFGYRKPTEKLEELVGSKGAVKKKKGGVPPAEHRRLGLQMAGRALRLATLGTFGTFGVLGAVGFYASGYKTMDECIESTTSWASGLRQSFEDWMGIEDRPSKTHPEVLATKHMNEDEILDYVYDKYVKEPDDENATTISQVDGDNAD